MDLQISLNGSFDTSVSLDLAELRDLLRAEGVDARPVTLAGEGAKSALVIGISIASLALSSISTTFAVLSFWQNQKKKSYRIVLRHRGVSAPLADLSSGAIEDMAATDASPQITIEKI